LLVNALTPEPPQPISEMAAALKHRSLITVCVALRTQLDAPYNWVYTPGKELRVGRIQNYDQWSKELASANWRGTYLGFEYHSEPRGELYAAGDDQMKSIVLQDHLRTLGIDESEVERITVERLQFAYPIYDEVRDRSVAYVRDYLTSHYPSLHPMGSKACTTTTTKIMRC
jgi:protoporphyrinogen oxidase